MLGAYCWLLWLVLMGGWTTFPWFPPDWFKVLAGVAALAPEALKGTGVLPIQSASLGIFGPLGISLALTCGPCSVTSRYAAD